MFREQFINPLLNRVKVVSFTAKYTIISNFLKKYGWQFFFSFLCIFQTRILTTWFQIKITDNSFRCFSIKPFDVVKHELTELYLFMSTLITDSSFKMGDFVEQDPLSLPK